MVYLSLAIWAKLEERLPKDSGGSCEWCLARGEVGGSSECVLAPSNL